MDAVQEQHELHVGTKFIDWLNARYGTHYAFTRRGADPPDLIFTDQGREMAVEIVGVYYDEKHAEILWAGARDVKGRARAWGGVNIDNALITNIACQIRRKCLAQHDANTVLLVAVRPTMTSTTEMEELLRRLVLPKVIPFTALYLAGDFPTTTRARGEYRVWPLYERREGPQRSNRCC